MMNLYKILVDGAEFLHYSYWEFTIITTTKQKAIEIVYKFVADKTEEIPDYLSKEKLKIEHIGTMLNVEEGFCNQVISYVYQE